MTYADLVRHLDWTTRSSSPYVTTSFSFFWCLWDAVRRYKLAVKHDVEIAIIDARKVRERAKTALEVLRGVEKDKQDKAYWKWYRFALESQDVLVFGAIPGDAIYASIPLTQILPKLPSYFFQDDVSKSDISSSSSSASVPRHTSHADFCKRLSAVFAKRPEADQLRDATTSAVGLAELLIEPWFRARCAEAARREAAAVLSELSLYLAHWPAEWW
ncbi:uncharacterized protein FOMMEDRAFT_32739, partial [Fomitiporia mediterranea MF3/22]|uniref:uncharacterized protein n=1 Tax=Fomitiporia mediterranea (strain MF3/22) TaxID=694068 RepID=UPI0004408E11